MTDPDAPPGRWPPLSVGFAAGLVAVPPLLVAAIFVPHADRPAVVIIPLAWMAAGVVNAGRLLRGRASGITWSVLLLVLYLLCVGAMLAVIVPAGGARDLPLVLVPLGYVAATAAFLWWPATRAWCGWLPAGDGPEGDR